jgi:hypothetical protein
MAGGVGRDVSTRDATVSDGIEKNQSVGWTRRQSLDGILFLIGRVFGVAFEDRSRDRLVIIGREPSQGRATHLGILE